MWSFFLSSSVTEDFVKVVDVFLFVCVYRGTWIYTTIPPPQTFWLHNLTPATALQHNKSKAEEFPTHHKENLSAPKRLSQRNETKLNYPKTARKKSTDTKNVSYKKSTLPSAVHPAAHLFCIFVYFTLAPFDVLGAAQVKNNDGR